MSGQGGSRQLRLALVCYGGSSLAVYMHGVTKELHRLVRASALLDDGAGAAPAAGVEAVYAQLLDAVAAERGAPRTRVVVDVVAGTSAGGINGVYLAKAIAHNRPLDALRDLWFARADMQELVTGWKAIPWKLRLLLQVPRIRKRYVTRGDEMARWLYDALVQMDAAPRADGELESLLPDAHELELFVTGTDFYGYDRQVAIAEPPLVRDRRHRHVFKFAYERDGRPAESDFGPRGNAGLAFAARTTSCFPAVFPPVSVGAFQEWVPESADDLQRFADGSCFRVYELEGIAPESAQLVDGGVLDNRPFRAAIDAIVERAADVEVERKLLYLEPDPRVAGQPRSEDPPLPLRAALSSIAGLPRQEPILDDLLLVGEQNERVERIREVIRTSFEPMRRIVAEEVGQPLGELPAALPTETLREWSNRMHDRAVREAGLGYVTYLRAKIAAAVAGYADAACRVLEYPRESNHARLVRAVVREHARRRGLFEEQEQPTEAQVRFLRAFDLGYGVRRLRFVAAALGWWYRSVDEPGCPAREQLDAGRARLYGAIDELRAVMSGDAFGDELRERLARCFPEEAIRAFVAQESIDAGAYLDQVEGDLRELEELTASFVGGRLAGFNERLYADLVSITDGWSDNCRRDLLVRYLGFPLWDALLFPLQEVSGAGERDAIDVVRLSPYEAEVLSTKPEDKVQGKKAGHFYAFFDRRARENDYLWGRLDGAAQLVGLLLAETDPEHGAVRRGPEHRDYRAWCLRAFEAILAEEEGALKSIPETVARLRAELAAAGG